MKILAAIITFLVSITTPASALSANDFYFEDATIDYYLEKTDTGSTMHVKEVLTAVFPETDQNHGITRRIPFTNLDGKNITVESINDLNLRVLRNGVAEPVSKIDQDSDEYILYIGSTSSYVHGSQVYTLEYDFKNVISEFTTSGENVSGEQSNNVAYQELYWDTIGTGWSQKFEKLTANLHLPADIARNLTAGTSCYVGYYGISGQSRCQITSDDETTYSPTSSSSTTTIDTPATTAETILTFETSNLSAGENLTFAVNFKPGTFFVPELAKDYTLVIATIIVAAICVLIILLVTIRFLKTGNKNRKYYKGLFIAPQYSPEKTYHVAEAAELSIGKTENSYVATLLELATSKKINIVKGEPTKYLKKDTWSLQINSTDDLTDSQTDLLKILNGGGSIKNVKEIKIKKHTATSSLAALSRLYHSDAIDKLKDLGLLTKKSSKKSSGVGLILAIIIFIFSFSWISVIGGALITVTKNVASGIGISTTGVLVGEAILPFAMIAAVVVTIIITITISVVNAKYKRYTEEGLRSAVYLEGLKLYIKMAEADRLKFLQSVKGADTSKEGIVKLYEKLLPYAALFGLEDSWMDEFNKYCQDINYTPTWYSGDDYLTGYMLGSMTSNVNSTVASSTSYSSSSSSGGSSFSSGGGGGGFSGGGGGGGGGGGW